MTSDIFASIGLVLNIVGVIGIAFFVLEVAKIGGGSTTVDSSDTIKKQIFYCLLILGFIFQLVSLWV